MIFKVSVLKESRLMLDPTPRTLKVIPCTYHPWGAEKYDLFYSHILFVIVIYKHNSLQII